jgi:hypothetical protein
MKCSSCNLVNFKNATSCKRCGNPLQSESENVNPGRNLGRSELGKRRLSDKTIQSIGSVLYFLSFFAAMFAGFGSLLLFGDARNAPAPILIWTFMGGAAAGLILMFYGVQRLKCWLAGESGKDIAQFRRPASAQSISFGVVLILVAVSLFFTLAAWERSGETTMEGPLAVTGLYIWLGKGGVAALFVGFGLFMIVDGLRHRAD